MDILLTGHTRVVVTNAGSLGNSNLGFDDINARNLFGDRVLDLNARVNLDEVELTRIHIDEKFSRARVGIARRPGKIKGRLAQF